MTDPTAQIPTDLLSLLRVVESSPPGDIEWARHCTRQQAAILLIEHPGVASSLPMLAHVVDIPIDIIESIPVPGTAFQTEAGWRIHVAAWLPSEKQLRTALHEFKHIIDHPLRNHSTRPAGLTAREYEQVADYFADIVLAGNKADDHCSIPTERALRRTTP